MRRWVDTAPLPKLMALIPPVLLTILWLMAVMVRIITKPLPLLGLCVITLAFVGSGVARTRSSSPKTLVLLLNLANLGGTLLLWATARPWGLGGWPFVAVSALASFTLIPGIIVAILACVPLVVGIMTASHAPVEAFQVLNVTWFDRQLLGLGILLTACVTIIRTIERNCQELRISQTLLGEIMVQKERNRIMYDLHDEVGHSPVQTSTQMDLLEMLLQRKQYATLAAIISEVGNQTRDTLLRMRSVVLDMNNVTLLDQLRRCGQLLVNAGLDVNQRISDIDEIPENQTRTYAAILQETVTNILRHSQASRVRITVEGPTLIVEDNGIGLDENHQVGLGMDAMRQRAYEAGLTFRTDISHDLSGLLVEVAKAPRKEDPR